MHDRDNLRIPLGGGARGKLRDGYLESSIEVWHKKHGLWIE
jgi:hypothetical protein